MNIDSKLLTLTVEVQWLPEVRYTAEGRKLCTFHVQGLPSTRFNCWDDELIDKMVELPEKALIKVVGTLTHKKTTNKRTDSELEYSDFTIRNFGVVSKG